MKEQGWIKAEWGMTESNRKARLHSRTENGHKQLKAELANWRRVTDGVISVIRFA